MTFLWLLTISTWSIAKGVNLENARDELESTHGKIVHASVIFRHGNRTPAYLFPTLKYDDSTWRPGAGQLDNDGKRLMYGLGKWFEKRYKNTELNEGYRRDFVRMDSSDKERTLDSAQLVLAGMFPPKRKAIWNDEDRLKWQPIPVHTKPRPTDEIIYGGAPCTLYKNERDLADTLPEWIEYYKMNRKVLLNVVSGAGIKVNKKKILRLLSKVSFALDTIQILRSYGLDVPEWAKDIDQDTIDSIVTMQAFSFVATKVMKRLRVGPLMASVIRDMKNKTENLTQQFLHFYSGHDYIIAAMLVTLQYFHRPVPYGAAIIVELREKDEERFVTVLYKETPDDRPRNILVPGCGDYCTLDNFIKHTEYLVPVDWQEECDLKRPIVFK